jgi:hypothetical protein
MEVLPFGRAPPRGAVASYQRGRMSTDVLSERILPVADALIARSNGKYDEEFLRILVANVASEFEGARVQDYIEVLVAKEAADKMRQLDALRPITS